MTGATGQVARSFAEAASGVASIEVEFAVRPLFDLAHPGSAERVIAAARPDLVINAAALTAVDAAESDSALAQRINASGACEVAAGARAVGAPVIQLSTDYVFDGQSADPYRVDHSTRPINVYGRSKLDGEMLVRSATPDHLILRTSWVYSPFGRNFVTTMLGLARDRDEVRVVADQRGSPTSALDLARALIAIAGRLEAGDRTGLGETYHLTGSGSCSWAEFAVEVFRLSAAHGGPAARVVPIATADYPTPAARPACSILDNGKFVRDFGFALPRWTESLAVVVERILETR